MSRKRRVLIGLFGTAVLVLALLVQNRASLWIGLLGAGILLSVLPYGSRSYRGRFRIR